MRVLVCSINEEEKYDGRGKERDRLGVKNWNIKSMEIVRKNPICGSVRAESPASS